MTNLRIEVAEQFKNDVANHKMTVLLDQGVHRHLRFARENSSIYSFSIVTFPGYLVVTGDMGAWTFTRLYDMFEFFGTGEINPSYWAEKCEAADKHSGITKFDPDKFIQHATENLNDFRECHDITNEEFDELKEELDSVFSALRDDELGTHAYDLLTGIRYNGREVFTDAWEWCDTKEFTGRYLWICHAIVYAIRKYKGSK